jgi:hypothetical protein
MWDRFGAFGDGNERLNEFEVRARSDVSWECLDRIGACVDLVTVEIGIDTG